MAIENVPGPVPIEGARLVTVAVIGAGQRGNAYAQYATHQPEACAIVAVAEPRPKTRERFVAAHGIDSSLVFGDWRDLLFAAKQTSTTLPGTRLADAIVVAVQDAMHMEVVLAFAELGYPILCEKPMATSVEDCLRMHAAVKKSGVVFGMGHVLRYSPYSKELDKIVRSGELGPIVNVVHVEPVGYFHFAHSYVRGNWSKEANSSFALMTKCCHDLDLLCHWFSSANPPVKVSSFGSLQHFKRAAKPVEAGNATRCNACPLERTCAYSATRIYLDPVTRGERGWPAATIVDGVPDIENIGAALADGPYGACVYEAPNDVCDNQVVNLQFADGQTAAFTMAAQTALICERQTRMHFAFGEVIGDGTQLVVNDFRTRTSRTLRPPRAGSSGHGDGDLGLMGAFVRAVRAGDQTALGTNADEVLRAHMTVFAAEASRREGRVVDCAEFEREWREKLSIEV